MKYSSLGSIETKTGSGKNGTGDASTLKESRATTHGLASKKEISGDAYSRRIGRTRYPPLSSGKETKPSPSVRGEDKKKKKKRSEKMLKGETAPQRGTRYAPWAETDEGQYNSR